MIYLFEVAIRSYLTDEEPRWETVGSGTAKGAQAWREQCAPRYRERGYRTRVRLLDED